MCKVFTKPSIVGEKVTGVRAEPLEDLWFGSVLKFTVLPARTCRRTTSSVASWVHPTFHGSDPGHLLVLVEVGLSGVSWTLRESGAGSPTKEHAVKTAKIQQH